MSTDTEWVEEYLEREASRAVVVDTLDDVVSGATILPLQASPGDRRRSPWTLVAGAAAVAALVGIGVAMTNRAEPATPINPAAAVPSGSAEGTVPAPTTAAPTTTLALPSAPEGGIWLGGQQPVCTAIDETSWSCTLPAPFAGDVPDYDDTGYALDYSSDDGVVTGGCRATNATADEWLCYAGMRAVEEEIVGESFLGDTVGTAFVPG